MNSGLGEVRICKVLTFPFCIVFRFAFLCSDFLFLFACLKPFICQIHLNRSTERVTRIVRFDGCRLKKTDSSAYFRRLTSSSMRSSFDFTLSCTLNVGSSPFNLGWSSGVLVGRERAFKRTERACVMVASSSSRFAVSLSSDSA